MQWKAIAKVVPAAVLLLGAAAAPSAQEASHGPHAHGAQAARDGDPSALFVATDLLFLTHMIVHHEQALVMSDLVPSRTERADFVRFARYVKRAQAAEIARMRALLGLAAERGIDVPAAVLHGDPPMAGMLSKAQMDALAAAERTEFERLWLEGMIFHHEGAMQMALAQQRAQWESGRDPYMLGVLIEDILVEQRSEITKMRAWLAEWGLAAAPRATDAPR